jgi:hypothetical protein
MAELVELNCIYHVILEGILDRGYRESGEIPGWNKPGARQPRTDRGR